MDVIEPARRYLSCVQPTIGGQHSDLHTFRVEDAPVVAGLAAASVQGTVALGPDRGACLRRLGEPREDGELRLPGGWHARANGFNLHAGLVVPAGQRDRLERGVSRCA